MIKRVKLENWRSHKNSELFFNNGTNVLIGKMGSGKTSIMNAICFALFGQFPELQRRETTIDKIIMNVPNKEETAKIELELTHLEKKYLIERTIFRGSKTNQAKLFIDGSMIAGPKVSDVNKIIEKKLEINYDLFTRAVYAEQNQIDYFLKLSSGERKTRFDELLDLNKYSRARKIGVSVKNSLKHILIEKRKDLENIKKENNLIDEQKQKEKLLLIEKEINELQQNILKEKKGLEELKKNVKELTEKKILFDELSQKKISSETKIQTIKNEINEIKLIFNGITEEKIKTTIEEKNKLIDEKKKEIDKILENEQKTISETAVLTAKLNEANDFLLELKKTESECPICGRLMNEHKKDEIIKERNQRIHEIENKQKEFNIKINEIKKINNEQNKELNNLEEEKINLENTLMKILDLQKKEKELIIEQNLLKEIIDKLKKLDFDEQIERKKSEELSLFNQKLNNLENNLKLQKDLENEVKKTLKLIEEQRERIKKLEKQIKLNEKNNEKMSLFINALQQTQADLRTNLIETINEAMNSIWQNIYPYKDYSNAKIEINEGNYDVKVLNSNNEWVKIEGTLSGGERSAAALTIRIAFSLVLAQNIGWIILDEPTHNLDSETITTLSLMLREKLPELISQIFLITHDKEMKNAGSGKIYLLERNKNQNGMTIPEEIVSDY